MPAEGFITAAEAGRRLRISASRVRQLVLAGRLPAQRFGWQLAIDPADLARVADRPNGRPVRKR